MDYIKAKITKTQSPIASNIVIADNNLAINSIIVGNSGTHLKASEISIGDIATKEYVDEHGGTIDSISIDGTPQTIDENKNVDLPAYPTKESLGLNNVDNTSDATKKTNFTGSIADENTGFVTGGDVYTALSGKQDELVSGTNIKTVNSNSLLGEGNIQTEAYHTFPNTWHIDHGYSTQQFCESVEDDASAVAGTAYLGTLGCNDLPANMGQAEAIVEIISNGANGKCMNITLTSLNRAPYMWTYSYGRVNGDIVTVGWTGIQSELNSSNKLSTSYVDGLATVATTGNYSDLFNRPSIPEAQIQSDWAQANSSKKDYIKNKPTIDQIYNSSSERAQSGIAVATAVSGATESIQGYVANNYVAQENGKGLSTNDFTDSYKSQVEANTLKVSNVQADWNAESGTTAEILNKPSVYTQSEINDFLILNITAADIDVEHSTPDYKAIIPETAEKIKSFKYRLKVDARLVDPGAAEGIYVVGNPVQIMPIDFLTEFPNATLYSFETASAFFTVSLAVVSFLDVIIDNEHRLLIWGTEDAVIPRGITDDYNHTLSLSDGDSGTISSVQFNTINNQTVFGSGNIDVSQASSISYLTTAPSSANTDGGLKFVVLSSEPATKYSGYIYIITA